MLRLAALLLSLTLLPLAACSSGGGGTRGSGDGGDNADCSTDADCAAGERCDALTGMCVAVPCDSDADCEGGVCNSASGECVGCLTDDDCGEEERCRDNSCEAASACSPPCGADEVCFEEAGECVECLADADCGEGQQCVDQACLFFCAQDSDCGPDLRCDAENGICVQCVIDEDCGPGLRCNAAFCEFFCSEDAHCGDDQVCDTETGECTGCVEDSDCGGDEICEDGSCLPGLLCESDEDCDNGRCDLDSGRCVECLTNAHCDEGAICDEGACREPSSCEEEGDCEPGQRCRPEDRQCVDCIEDADCGDALVCDLESGVCLPEGPCTGDDSCPPGERCDIEAGDCVQCLESADCREDRWCDDGGRCRPDLCTAEEGRCDGQTATACAEDGSGFLDPVDCEAGTFCDTGACVPQICTPGENACNGDNITICNDAGSGFIDDGVPCGEGRFCGDGRCQDQVCEPGTGRCLPPPPEGGEEMLEICDERGSGVEVESCGPSAFCDAGTCQVQVCEPGSAFCGDAVGTLERCGPRGMGTQTELCPADSYCDDGRCFPQICEPDSAGCVGEGSTFQCNADGSDRVVTPCPAEERCFSGRCVGADDRDGDGLLDLEEDANQNGVVDEGETDPDNPDTDGDGLLDGAERLEHDTDPLRADTDGDGCDDGAEIDPMGTDPNVADTDGDGVPDGSEDRDCDGEIVARFVETDPNLADTDGDGQSDGEEGLATVCDAAIPGTTVIADPDLDITLGLSSDFGAVTPFIDEATGEVVGLTFDDDARELRGFVVRVPDLGGSSIFETADQARTRIDDTNAIDTTFRRSRVVQTPGDGAAVIDRFDLTVRGLNTGGARNVIAAGLRGETTAAFEDLPAPRGASSNEMVVLLEVMFPTARGQILVGVVTTRSAASAPGLPRRMWDVAGGSAVALGSTLGSRRRCRAFATGANESLDVLFVLDTSASVDEARGRIVTQAEDWLGILDAAGIDYRFGVHIDQLGARFEGFTSDRGTFEDRVRSTPTGGGFEYGLEGGAEALAQSADARSLVRRWRQGSKRVALFLSDEEDQTIKDECLGGAGSQCAEDLSQCEPMNGFLDAYGEAGIEVHSVVGDLPCACNDIEAGNGQMTLTRFTGGSAGTICDLETGESLGAAMRQVIGALSDWPLARVALPSTLAVSVGGRVAPRSRSNGFDYDTGTGRLLFFGDYVPGYDETVVVSYVGWDNNTLPGDDGGRDAPPVELPENCAGVTPIELPVGEVLELEGDTSSTSDAFTGLCAGGPGAADNIYGFVVEAPTVISAELNAEFDGDIYLARGCDALAREDGFEICGAGLISAEVQPGTWYIVVDGHSDEDDGEFTLRVAAGAGVLTPGNDDCSAPRELVLDPDGAASVPADLSAAGDELAGSCGGDGAADLIYALEITEPSTVIVRTSTNFSGAAYLQGSCADPATELACSNSGVLRVDGVEPGVWTLVLDGVSSGLEAVDLNVQVFGAPDNDVCADAEPLDVSGGRVRVTGILDQATDSLDGECSFDAAADLWYTFQTTDFARISAQVLNNDPGAAASVHLFSGDCDGLEPVACQQATFFDPTADIEVVPMPPGQWYLMVENQSDQGSDFELLIEVETVPAPPEGDSCTQGPIVITPIPEDTLELSGDTTEAYDNHNGGCGAFGATRDLVYTFELSEARAITLELESEFDAALVLRRGRCGGPGVTDLECQNALNTAGVERINQPRLAAGIYYVIVDGAADDQFGNYTLRISDVEPLPVGAGEDCSNPIDIDVTGGEGSASGTTVNAMADFAPACGAVQGGGGDLVYSFTLTDESETVVQLNSASRHLIEVRAGDCVDVDTSIHCSPPGFGSANYVAPFPSLAAGDYFIIVADNAGSASFDLSVRTGPPVAPTLEAEPNDTLATAQGPFPAGSTYIDGRHQQNSEDWYLFEVPDGADVEIQVYGPDGGCTTDLFLELLTAAGAAVGTDDDDGPGLCSHISYERDAFASGMTGGTYAIKVRGFSANSSSGDYQLYIRTIDPAP